MTPLQLTELRSSLPPFPQAASEVPGMAEFCQYYGLDTFTGQEDLQHSVGTVSSGPFQLAVHFWQHSAARGTLLLLHGYFDHCGLYGKMIEYGLSRGYNVLIFDLPGHGLSTGEAAVIDDFAAYGQAVADVLAAVELPAKQPLWVMAQSTGSASLVEFARSQPWPFSAAVLLAPLVRPMSWTRVRLGHTLLHKFKDSMQRTFNQNSSDPQFLAFLQQDPLQCRQLSLRWVGALRRWLAALPESDLGVGPVLVVQGDSDGTVEWRYNINVIVKLFPGSRVEYLAGAGHQLANESQALRDKYLAAVDDYLSANFMRESQANAVPQPLK